MRKFRCGWLLVGLVVSVVSGGVQAVEADPASGVKMTRLGVRGFDPNAPGHVIYQQTCAAGMHHDEC